MAVGSETDGSIVCPASLNGCVGIKPTVGSIPRDAMIPISASQDTPGPMAQSVAQAALLLEVLTGKGGYQSAINDGSEIRIGVVTEWVTQNPGTNQLFQELVSKLSKHVKVVELSLPAPSDQEGEAEFKVLMHELNEDLASYLATRQGARVKTLQDVVDLVKSKPANLHLCLTGHDHFKELENLADLVTEMKMVKHPYYHGIMAQQGIDY